MIDAFENAPHSKRRIVVAVPVRHAKSTTAADACAWLIARNPRLDVIYASYSATFAQRQSRIIRNQVLEAGVPLSSDHNTIQSWRTAQGGIFLATGVDGAATGFGAGVIVVDDSIKSREEAESPLIRDKVWEWLHDVLLTRLTPTGSAFIIASRWHVDDPSGRAIKKGWEHIHMRALDDEGRALWPEERPAEFLQSMRSELGEYAFASLYQGEPIPRSGSLFNAPPFYDEPPATNMRIVIGCDLAYSAGAKSDYSAAVVLGLDGATYYVLDVIRMQSHLPDVEAAFKVVQAKHGAARWYSYVAAGERGPLMLMAQRGLTIYPLPARHNKYVRAQKCAEVWNSGRIHVPSRAPWITEFLDEVCSFSGNDDAHDDMVDALVSAFDMLHGVRQGVAPALFGERRM